MRTPIKKLGDNFRSPGSNLRLRVLPLVVLGLAIAVAMYLYAESLDDFFYYDDLDFLVRGKQINLKSLGPFFRPESYWRPIVSLHFGAAFPLFHLNPFPYHLFSLLLHLTNVILLYFLARRLFSNPMRAALVAALFAVSSKFTNAVHWISCVGDIYALFFGLVSILFFLEYLRKKKAAFIISSLLTYSFALLSKETMVGLPALLWISETYVHKRSTSLREVVLIKDRWKKYVPFLILWIIYLVIIAIRIGSNLYISRGEYSFIPNIYNIYIIAGEALVNVHHWDLFVFALLICVFYVSLKTPLCSAKYGLLWFFVAIVPLLPFQIPVISERFFYMPMVGLYLLAVALFGGLFDRLRKSRYPQSRFVVIIIVMIALVASSQGVIKDIARFGGICEDFRLQLEQMESELDRVEDPNRFAVKSDIPITLYYGIRDYIFLRHGIWIPHVAIGSLKSE